MYIRGHLNMAGGLCDDLIISEYLEGTSQNKAFKSTTHPRGGRLGSFCFGTLATTRKRRFFLRKSLDLTVCWHLEGCTSWRTPRPGPIVSVADTLSTVTWVNGNDALVLRKNGEIINRWASLVKTQWGLGPLVKAPCLSTPLFGNPTLAKAPPIQ